jgi:hypothetical protein
MTFFHLYVLLCFCFATWNILAKAQTTIPHKKILNHSYISLLTTSYKNVIIIIFTPWGVTPILLREVNWDFVVDIEQKMSKTMRASYLVDFFLWHIKLKKSNLSVSIISSTGI